MQIVQVRMAERQPDVEVMGSCASGWMGEKLEVYDWLADMDLPVGQKPIRCGGGSIQE